MKRTQNINEFLKKEKKMRGEHKEDENNNLTFSLASLNLDICPSQNPMNAS